VYATLLAVVKGKVGALLSLTGRAVKGAALARKPANPRAASGRAGLPGLVIHQMPLLISPSAPVRRHEIPDAGATRTDGLGQHRPHRLVEPPDGPITQPAGSPIRMQASAIQNFVRVDVADPGNHLLMHQQGLHTASAILDHLPEALPGDGERIASKPPGGKPFEEGTVQELDPTKPPGIPVSQLGFRPSLKRQHQMRVLGIAGVREPKQEQAGHPELRDEIPGLIGSGEGQ